MSQGVTGAFPLALKLSPTNQTSLLSLSCSATRTGLASLRFGRRSQIWFREEEEEEGRRARGVGRVLASKRGYRNARRGSKRRKEKELEYNVEISIEDELPEDPEVLSIAEMLQLNATTAIQLAFGGIKESTYKTRDTAIRDVGGFESVELFVLLCNDEFIRKLNKDWRDEDHATDVISISQHIPELKLPTLMLGDLVISVETAARQAKERGHSLLDEIRILMVHGLLHLLGFDHEISNEAETEMENQEELLLKSLGWKGKGLIQYATDVTASRSLQPDLSDGEQLQHSKRGSSLRFYKPKFSYMICDLDGTLLNSEGQISSTTAGALRDAMSKGVKVVIATGKARPSALSSLEAVDLAGKDGIVSEFSPGVFLQGLIVYGRQGREIFRGNLDSDICKQAFSYSWEHKVPLVAFGQDRCLTLFEHPLIDSLHTIYHEPKAEVMPNVEDLLAAGDIQKMLFFDTPESITSTLKPYWSEITKGRAGFFQAMPNMLEIAPFGTSKGSGVKMLLEHFHINAEEVMAIGDGDNDIEMLELVSLGVALSNGSEKAKAAADVIGLSNDEDGVADAIYRYLF